VLVVDDGLSRFLSVELVSTDDLELICDGILVDAVGEVVNVDAVVVVGVLV